MHRFQTKLKQKKKKKVCVHLNSSVRSQMGQKWEQLYQWDTTPTSWSLWLRPNLQLMILELKKKITCSCLDIFCSISSPTYTVKRPGASLERSGGRPCQPGGTQEGGPGVYTKPNSRLSAGDRLGSPGFPRDRPPASVDGPEKLTVFPFEQPPPPPLLPAALSLSSTLSLSPSAPFLCGPNEWFI